MNADPELLFLDAVGTAEIARDMLTYVHRDAIKLAEEARRLPSLVLLDPDPSGRAYAIASRAIKLEQKIKMLIERLDPMLVFNCISLRLYF